jgi:signal transduction histidine kinase/DNA-binding response OmpR family regulator
MTLFVGLAAHDLYETWTQRSRDIADTRRDVENLAWSTAQHATDAFRQADVAVAGLVDLIEIDGTNPVQIERLRKLMRRRLANSPILQGVAYYDETGTALANGLPETVPINISDRPYFQYHVANAERGPYTSELLLSRFSGDLVVTVSRRVDHADGSFAGVVSAAIRFSYLRELYATFRLGHEGLVSLLRDDGTLLVRQPLVDAAIGTNLGSDPAYREILRATTGGTREFHSPIDGVLRVYSYQRVTGFPLLAVAALGVNEELANWRATALEHLVTMIAVALLLGFFVFRLSIQIRLLARAERDAAANNAELAEAAMSLAAARDQSEQANQAKSRFLTGITHELRTPLHGILGYAELLSLEGGLNPPQSERVAAMIAAGEHLLGMINAVLEVSQIEADRLELFPVDIELADFARACLNVVRPAAEKKGLDLVHLIPEPILVRADPTRLRQVVINLLGNAIKFTPVGRIELRMAEATDRAFIRLEVADTGPGIRAGNRGKLFQVFERLNANAVSGIEGAGLGLALAAGLVQAMDGRIGYADNPGGGSVFWLELPAGDATLIATGVPASACRMDQPRLRVLVVDDDALNRDIARNFLSLGGHEVLCVDNGAAAVAAAKTTDFDVILMDVRMPVMNGLEATRQIRGLPGRRGSVPVIAITAQAFAEQIEMCRQAGMNTHISKPFSQSALLAAVQEIVTATRGAGSASVAAATAPPQAPLWDRDAFADTAEGLPPEDVEQHLQTLLARGESLLRLLLTPEPLARAGELAEAAHRLAGGAGTLGFHRLSQVGRQFEHAADAGEADAELAEQFAVTIKATLAVIRQALVDITEAT